MTYKAINCTFHDLLMDRASRKVNCRILFLEEGIEKLYEGKIIDVYSKKGEEFLIGEESFKIRLDKIIRLDSIKSF